MHCRYYFFISLVLCKKDLFEKSLFVRYGHVQVLVFSLEKCHNNKEINIGAIESYLQCTNKII